MQAIKSLYNLQKSFTFKDYSKVNVFIPAIKNLYNL